MINIAIDGPSSAGKSTIAKRLASKLNYVHLDTGAMYRCCALECRNKNIDSDNEKDIKKIMDEIEISFSSDGRVFLNGEDVSDAIRTNEISMKTSQISSLAIVREKMVDLQRKVAANKGYILDGRDIGTVVLKDAEVKIFMVASVECRAKRRYKEYLDKNIEADYDEIYHDIEKRDYQDTHREISPLRKADDAIEVDTSEMNIEEVVACIENIIKEKV